MVCDRGSVVVAKAELLSNNARLKSCPDAGGGVPSDSPVAARLIGVEAIRTTTKTHGTAVIPSKVFHPAIARNTNEKSDLPYTTLDQKHARLHLCRNLILQSAVQSASQ